MIRDRLVMALVALIAAMLPATAARSAEAFIDGGWRVLMLEGQPVLPQPALAMEFTQGRVSGLAGCNRFAGTVTLTGETLRISQVAATMMACTQPGLADQEARFLAALTGITRIRFDSPDRLALLAGESPVLTLERAR